MKVYLSLGSNLGDRLSNLDRALLLLGRGGCRIVKRSSVYETAPLYYLKQPAFFNMAAACETSLSPEKLLALIARVETALKRRRLIRNGPRTLDVDILFYGGQALSRPGLNIPHPRLGKREFVLAPLAEIAHGLRHPVTGLSVEKMFSGLKERGGARRLPKTYSDLEAWLKALPPPAADAHYSLGPIKAALAALGGPEKRMGLVVHIAGSTGKTSSACMTAAALSACGHRTGLYTSPHVRSMRERIKIDGRDITEKDFLDCFLRVESLSAGELSFFETLTAMAFLYFSRNKTRFSVVEAGLGGRLDATNASDADVAGITSISLEHLNLLGPRLVNVASHKAGIIKEGSSVLAGWAVPPAALSVIARRAEEMNAGLSRPSRFTAFLGPAARKGGKFQAVNAAFALNAALMAAERAGADFSLNKAAAALPAAIPPGRFERFLLDGRIVIVDGAHNAEGMSALLKEFAGVRPVCVAAFMSDKALAPLAEALASASSKLILTRSLSYRSAEPEAVKKLLPSGMRRGVKVIEDPLKALKLALRLASKGGTVLIAGSLYLAGDILSGLKGRKAFHPREMLIK
ncbi:MAG: 2-amino-4-hydroxy-6-hydroxymethyldihydropteridine diphosphokinase [Elusimicrobiales bacterium]|nr:2-amino-4-hydroxy-6-hydroxymethyldihydropteridine diphosphokinase [Elusimicrobiales bacterium]